MIIISDACRTPTIAIFEQDITAVPAFPSYFAPKKGMSVRPGCFRPESGMRRFPAVPILSGFPSVPSRVGGPVRACRIELGTAGIVTR